MRKVLICIGNVAMGLGAIALSFGIVGAGLGVVFGFAAAIAWLAQSYGPLATLGGLIVFGAAFLGAGSWLTEKFATRTS